MVSVEEATKIIHQNLWQGRHEPVSLLAAMNRILAGKCGF
jgi:molybdopterin biosynthesis enzyme